MTDPVLLETGAVDASGAPREPEWDALKASAPIALLLESFPEPVMVLDSERRLVLANQRLLEMLGESSVDALRGARPGDLLHCLHTEESGKPCGSTPACTYCGAFNSILSSQRSGEPSEALGRFLTRRNGILVALDLQIRATPLALPGVPGIHTVFALRDVSSEHRRRALEQIFFHDLLDAMGALRALLEILPHAEGEESDALHTSAVQLLDESLEEVYGHRDIAAAEQGLLATMPRNVSIAPLLDRLVFRFRHHPLARGRVILPPDVFGNPVLRTDETLLTRVLTNLLKNALEASSPGGTVSISCRNEDGAVFQVASEAAMTPEVSTQVFKRSFSTKAGAGRGLGTFSVKLLVENYLRGTVSFTSSAGAGTVFTVIVPNLGS